VEVTGFEPEVSAQDRVGGPWRMAWSQLVGRGRRERQRAFWYSESPRSTTLRPQEHGLGTYLEHPHGRRVSHHKQVIIE
jgi:hypothetical protein